MYRDISFNTQDLLDIRYVIHHKVEQVLSQSSLWKDVMPERIFKDLVNFVGDSSFL